MKTKSSKKSKVNIITLGCSKNLVDSEVLLTQLKANNINATHQEEDNAEVVIINTCGFIDNAKQESIDTILEYANLKDQGDIEKLYVTGCLSQRYKDDLEKDIPNVDAYFGTMELPLLLNKFNADYKHELLGQRLTTTDKHYAYLKISEGCDRPCSFCAIPLMRGKHVSKPIEELVKESQHLASQGVKELLLIAQDSTYYGLDLYKKRALVDLMDQLSQVEGIEWIRLHYAFPTGFPEDILEVIQSNPKVCKYLDIPLQHASSKVLKIMRRGINLEKTKTLVEKIRAKVPGIAIRTTFIVGHPGEEEEDFEELLSFVKEMRFERVGVFTYSHEEDTHAYSMEDHVPEEVKEERARILMEAQQEISREHNEKLIGKSLKVLIDRVEGDYFVGRTEFDSPEVDNEVLISKKDHFLRLGDFVNIKIFDADDFDLYGEPDKQT